MTDTFTAADKRKALEREIALRRNVYARRVSDGKMKRADAEREIAVMEAIRADYVEAEKKERLPL